MRLLAISSMPMSYDADGEELAGQRSCKYICLLRESYKWIERRINKFSHHFQPEIRLSECEETNLEHEKTNCCCQFNSLEEIFWTHLRQSWAELEQLRLDGRSKSLKCSFLSKADVSKALIGVGKLAAWLMCSNVCLSILQWSSSEIFHFLAVHFYKSR